MNVAIFILSNIKVTDLITLVHSTHVSGGSKGGTPPARAPLGAKFFEISCSFLENFGKIVGWLPLLRGMLDPPRAF